MIKRRRPNPVVLLFCMFSVSALLASTSLAQNEAPPDAPTVVTSDETNIRDTVGDPVILEVNRNLTVKGVIELEDDEVIVVRDRRDKVHSFPIVRVLRIVRLTEPEPGQGGVVVLRNGQTRKGVVIEDAFDYVLMEIEGIRAKLDRDVVYEVLLDPTFEEKYKAYKAQLEPGMTRRHLQLCQWLFEQRKLEEARAELEELLAEEENPAARRMLLKVDGLLSLRNPRNDETDAPKSTTEPNADASKSDSRAKDFASREDIFPGGLLTPEEINLIKVYEIDLEHPPRVNVSKDTVRKIIDNYGSNSLVPNSQVGRTAMHRAESIDIVDLMFRLRARDLYSEIEVMSEPKALDLFRKEVHDNWLIQNCATSRCHGGPNDTGFMLHARNHQNERVRYTNFLILERTKTDSAWPLINYDQPEKSLLIQYGMPQRTARQPHPDVPGWSPVFTRGRRQALEHTKEWINSMMQPRPVYPIEYEPPTATVDTLILEDDGEEGERAPR